MGCHSTTTQPSFQTNSPSDKTGIVVNVMLGMGVEELRTAPALFSNELNKNVCPISHFLLIYCKHFVGVELWNFIEKISHSKKMEKLFNTINLYLFSTLWSKKAASKLKNLYTTCEPTKCKAA